MADDAASVTPESDERPLGPPEAPLGAPGGQLDSKGADNATGGHTEPRRLDLKAQEMASIAARRAKASEAEEARHAEEQAAMEAARAWARAVGNLARLRESWRTAVPSRFLWASLDKLADEPRQAIEAWQATNRNLVIVGPTGSGKTYAAIAACRAAHDAGLDLRFAPVVELLDDLRPGGTGEWSEYAAVDRLILDDIGAEKGTEWTVERLYAVVNRRWLEERPTIVTANLSTAAMREAIGERTTSRLVGDGAVVVKLTGADRRRAPTTNRSKLAT